MIRSKLKPQWVRIFAGLIFKAAGLTLLYLFMSGLIPRRVMGACYGDVQIEGGCELAASGWPFAFIHDGYTSPVNSADWLGLLIGSDILQTGPFQRAFWLCALLGLFTAAVRALTRAETADNRKLQYIFKPLCAALFLAIPTVSSLAVSSPNLWFFSGLIACAIGDLCLLSRQRPWLFKLGMAAFAAGHLAYIGGFVSLILYQSDSLPLWPFAIAAIITIFAAARIWHWLSGHLPPDMRAPTFAYMIIIGTMVILALGSFFAAPFLLPLMAAVAACLFAVSDIYVARDRFVIHEPKNARRITPLYFGAQLLFALLASI